MLAMKMQDAGLRHVVYRLGSSSLSLMNPSSKLNMPLENVVHVLVRST